MRWFAKAALGAVMVPVTVAAALVSAGVVFLTLFAVKAHPPDRGPAAWVLKETGPERLQELATQLTASPAAHGRYVHQAFKQVFPTHRGDLSLLPAELAALQPTTVRVDEHVVRLEWVNREHPDGLELLLLAPGADASSLRSPRSPREVTHELHERIWSRHRR